jgi:F0F1-type ATP synthase assembly protein I
MPSPDNKKNPWVQVTQYAHLGVALPAATAAGYFLGVLLDHLLGTDFLYLVFLIVGIAAGFLELYRVATRNSG